MAALRQIPPNLDKAPARPGVSSMDWLDGTHRTWPPGLVARTCDESDAEALWALFDQPDFRRFAMMDPAEFETPEAVSNWLHATRAGAFRTIGSIDDRLVGFAGLYPMRGRQNHAAWITLTVDEAFRGRGVGASLLRLLLATADVLAGLRRVQLHVLADNEPALALYQAFGFRIEGRHEALVQSGDGYVDVYTMARLV